MLDQVAVRLADLRRHRLLGREAGLWVLDDALGVPTIMSTTSFGSPIVCT
jgi:hypothetical protein